MSYFPWYMVLQNRQWIYIYIYCIASNTSFQCRKFMSWCSCVSVPDISLSHLGIVIDMGLVWQSPELDLGLAGLWIWVLLGRVQNKAWLLHLDFARNEESGWVEKLRKDPSSKSSQENLVTRFLCLFYGLSNKIPRGFCEHSYRQSEAFVSRILDLEVMSQPTLHIMC